MILASDLIILLTIVLRLKPTAQVQAGRAELEGSIVIDYGKDDTSTLDFSAREVEIIDNLNLNVQFYRGYAEVGTLK